MKNRNGKALSTNEPASSVSKATQVAKVPESGDAASLAKMALKPSVNAAAVIVAYGKPFGEPDMVALMGELSNGMEGVWAGDMKRAEAMLYGQAHALQSIFMNFSRRALNQEYQKNLEGFLRMALKAQNQCRMTLETLATIKNPPVVFARQANINNGGQQQVNNGTATHFGAPVRACAGASAHAAISKTEQTGLLEACDGQGLDTGTAGTSGRADPHLAPVGAIDRATHS